MHKLPLMFLFQSMLKAVVITKQLKLYNGTGAAIDLAAGNYVIQMYFNGSTSSGNTITLTGTVASGAVFVLANASASFASQPYVNQTNSRKLV